MNTRQVFLLVSCVTACGGEVVLPGSTSDANDAGAEIDAAVPLVDTGARDGDAADSILTPDATTESGALDGAPDSEPDVGVDSMTPPDAEVDAACVPTCDGDCVAGRCFVALSSAPATRLAVSAKDVYWLQATETAVMTMPIDGGVPTTIASGRQYGDIAVDANNVYWTDKGTNADPAGAVLAMPLGGGAITTLASAQSGPDCLAVDASNIYWKVTVCPDAGGLCGAAIVTAPLAGGAPSTLTFAMTAAPVSMWGLALDTASLYWTGQPVNTLNGGVMQLALDGGTVATLVSGKANAFDIAADGTNVYFSTETGPGGVYELPVVGGALVTLASSAPYSFGITVDATDVYWTASGSGTMAGVLAKTPIGGGAITTLASALPEPYDVAVDATSLYFTSVSLTNGGVVKVTPK